MNTPDLYYYDPSRTDPNEQTLETDLCIYGGTAAGVAAAVQASRMGQRVVLLETSGHLGGMTSGGLSFTDIGNKEAIGGISREFYRRVGRQYGVEEEWRFEPRVAELVLQEMVREARVPVLFRQFLRSVERDDERIAAVTMESGLTVEASMFIDATYEGDLMARAGVTYHVGRESNATYGETLNGVQVQDKHQFQFPVDPYVVEGDPASGLLPGINPGDPGRDGEGDDRIQAYNFRLCLANAPANWMPFPKPEGYDPWEYVLLARYLATGWDQVFRKFDPIRGSKVDMNNHGAVSSDYIGANYDYPEGDYTTRERIFQAHVTFQQGLMWFLANARRCRRRSGSG
jgi:hypothetical protein